LQPKGSGFYELSLFDDKKCKSMHEGYPIKIAAGGISCNLLFHGAKETGEGDVYLNTLAADPQGHLKRILIESWQASSATEKAEQEALVLSASRKQHLPHQTARAELKRLGVTPSKEDHATARRYAHDLADGPYAHLAPLAMGATSPEVHCLVRLRLSESRKNEQPTKADDKETVNQLWLLKNQGGDNQEADTAKGTSSVLDYLGDSCLDGNFDRRNNADQKCSLSRDVLESIATWGDKEWAFCATITVTLKLFVVDVTGGVSICVQPYFEVSKYIQRVIKEKHGGSDVDEDAIAKELTSLGLSSSSAVTITVEACAGGASWSLGIELAVLFRFTTGLPFAHPALQGAGTSGGEKCSFDLELPESFFGLDMSISTPYGDIEPIFGFTFELDDSIADETWIGRSGKCAAVSADIADIMPGGGSKVHDIASDVAGTLKVKAAEHLAGDWRKEYAQSLEVFKTGLFDIYFGAKITWPTQPPKKITGSLKDQALRAAKEESQDYAVDFAVDGNTQLEAAKAHLSRSGAYKYCFSWLVWANSQYLVMQRAGGSVKREMPSKCVAALDSDDASHFFCGVDESFTGCGGTTSTHFIPCPLGYKQEMRNMNLGNTPENRVCGVDEGVCRSEQAALAAHSAAVKQHIKENSAYTYYNDYLRQQGAKPKGNVFQVPKSMQDEYPIGWTPAYCFGDTYQGGPVGRFFHECSWIDKIDMPSLEPEQGENYILHLYNYECDSKDGDIYLGIVDNAQQCADAAAMGGDDKGATKLSVHSENLGFVRGMRYLCDHYGAACLGEAGFMRKYPGTPASNAEDTSPNAVFYAGTGYENFCCATKSKDGLLTPDKSMCIFADGCPLGYTMTPMLLGGDPSSKCKGEGEIAIATRCEWTGYNPRTADNPTIYAPLNPTGEGSTKQQMQSAEEKKNFLLTSGGGDKHRSFIFSEHHGYCYIEKTRGGAPCTEGGDKVVIDETYNFYQSVYDTGCSALLYSGPVGDDGMQHAVVMYGALRTGSGTGNEQEYSIIRLWPMAKWNNWNIHDNPISSISVFGAGCEVEVMEKGADELKSVGTVYGGFDAHAMYSKSALASQGIQLSKATSLIIRRAAVDPEENFYRRDPTLGNFGGLCVCPDGKRFSVGDVLFEDGSGCAALACAGGTSGNCGPMIRENEVAGKGYKVTCAGAHDSDYTWLPSQPAVRPQNCSMASCTPGSICPPFAKETEGRNTVDALKSRSPALQKAVAEAVRDASSVPGLKTKQYPRLGICQCPDGSQHRVFAASTTIEVPTSVCSSHVAASKHGDSINSCVGGQFLADTCRVPESQETLPLVTCGPAVCETCPAGTYGAGGTTGECEPCVCSKQKEDRDNDPATPCQKIEFGGVVGEVDGLLKTDVEGLGQGLFDRIPPELREQLPSVPELCAMDPKMQKICDVVKSVLGLDNQEQGTSLSFGPLSVVVTNDDTVFNLPSELVDMLALAQCPDFADFMKRNWVFMHLNLAELMGLSGVDGLDVGLAVSYGKALIYVHAKINDVAAVADAIAGGYNSIDGTAGDPYFSTTFLKGAKASFTWTHQDCSEEESGNKEETGQDGYCALNALAGSQKIPVTIKPIGQCVDKDPEWKDAQGDTCSSYAYESHSDRTAVFPSPVNRAYKGSMCYGGILMERNGGLGAYRPLAKLKWSAGDDCNNHDLSAQFKWSSSKCTNALETNPPEAGGKGPGSCDKLVADGLCGSHESPLWGCDAKCGDESPLWGRFKRRGLCEPPGVEDNDSRRVYSRPTHLQGNERECTIERTNTQMEAGGARMFVDNSDPAVQAVSAEENCCACGGGRQVFDGNAERKFVYFEMDDTYVCPDTVNKDNWLNTERGPETFSVTRSGKNIRKIERIDSKEPWTFTIKFACEQDPYALDKMAAFSNIDPIFAGLWATTPLGLSFVADVTTPKKCTESDKFCKLLALLQVGSVHLAASVRLPQGSGTELALALEVSPDQAVLEICDKFPTPCADDDFSLLKIIGRSFSVDASQSSGVVITTYADVRLLDGAVAFDGMGLRLSAGTAGFGLDIVDEDGNVVQPADLLDRAALSDPDSGIEHTVGAQVVAEFMAIPILHLLDPSVAGSVTLFGSDGSLAPGLNLALVTKWCLGTEHDCTHGDGDTHTVRGTANLHVDAQTGSGGGDLKYAVSGSLKSPSTTPRKLFFAVLPEFAESLVGLLGSLADVEIANAELSFSVTPEWLTLYTSVQISAAEGGSPVTLCFAVASRLAVTGIAEQLFVVDVSFDDAGAIGDALLGKRSPEPNFLSKSLLGGVKGKLTYKAYQCHKARLLEGQECGDPLEASTVAATFGVHTSAWKGLDEGLTVHCSGSLPEACHDTDAVCQAMRIANFETWKASLQIDGAGLRVEFIPTPGVWAMAAEGQPFETWASMDVKVVELVVDWSDESTAKAAVTMWVEMALIDSIKMPSTVGVSVATTPGSLVPKLLLIDASAAGLEVPDTVRPVMPSDSWKDGMWLRGLGLHCTDPALSGDFDLAGGAMDIAVAARWCIGSHSGCQEGAAPTVRGFIDVAVKFDAAHPKDTNIQATILLRKLTLDTFVGAALGALSETYALQEQAPLDFDGMGEYITKNLGPAGQLGLRDITGSIELSPSGAAISLEGVTNAPKCDQNKWGSHTLEACLFALGDGYKAKLKLSTSSVSFQVGTPEMKVSPLEGFEKVDMGPMGKWSPPDIRIRSSPGMGMKVGLEVKWPGMPTSGGGGSGVQLAQVEKGALQLPDLTLSLKLGIAICIKDNCAEDAPEADFLRFVGGGSISIDSATQSVGVGMELQMQGWWWGLSFAGLVRRSPSPSLPPSLPPSSLPVSLPLFSCELWLLFLCLHSCS
jgi:hypothetical protein